MTDHASSSASPDPGAGPPREIDVSVPQSARVWNYWLGGKDNYEVDRQAGDATIEVFPAIVDLARVSRYWLGRTVRHLAGEAGVRQFLDVGTGLPTVDNTHEIAQRVAPESRIVYVDHDPLVLAHARALLTSSPQGATAYIDADLREPDRILATAMRTLEFSRPVGLMLMGVLGFVADYDEARSIVRRLLDPLPSGSYLTLWDAVDTDEEFAAGTRSYNETGSDPYTLRSPEQVAGFFEGLELVEPGVSELSAWRPDTVEVGAATPVFARGAVGRKP